MTNAKSTKKALLMSALSLLLCFSMLVGTTFAWFTDSVSSTNNIIKAGNLDIVLEYWDGDSWEDVAGRSDILTNSLWEPGVTEVAYLRVANAGTLALKYQLGVNIVSELAGVNAAGDSFKLSDYIQFGVVEGVNGETGAYATREAAVAAATNAQKISAGYNKATSMVAGDELYLALVVYMPTDVDNVANHNGTNVPKIELGINVFATQLTAEVDSFDEYYDGGAKWLGDIDTTWYDANATEYVIGNPEQLAGLAQLVNTGVDSFAGKTVKLVSNLDLNNLDWAPIGNWDNVFAGTFDGNGMTISNLYINDADGEGVGFFGVTEKATIENLTIRNVDITAYSMVAGVVGAAYPATVSNCHIAGTVNIVSEWAYVAGIAGYCYYGTQVDGCSVIAATEGLIESETRNAVGGITAWLLEGDHKVTNCAVENLNLVGWTNIGGITGFVHYSNTIENCSVKNVNLTKTRGDGNPGIGLIAGGWSYSANNAITLKNNTISGATLNGTHVAYAAYNELYGSEYGGATTTNFVLENNNSTNVTNNLVEVTKVSDGIVADTNGTKLIYNAAGLKSLSGQKISGNYALAADIDLGGAEFKAMSAWYNTASFNGNGHTISNAKVVSGDNDNGMEQASMFFVSTNGALTVSDLVLKNLTVETKNIDNGYGAAVVGYCEGKLVLDNVDVVNTSVTGSKSSGMLVGHLTPAGSLTATNCDVAGSITISSFEASGHYAGKYVGTIAGNTALNNCTANVTLGGNLKSSNAGDIYGRKVSGVLRVNGKELMNAPVTVAPAPLQQDFIFPAGTNAVLYKDVAMTGDAQITHTENAVLGLSNVTGELDHDVIIRKSGGAIVIENCNFTLTNGAKLISVGEGGDAYQVFMVNVTINGVLMDNTTIWNYVDGISYISIVSEWPNT